MASSYNRQTGMHEQQRIEASVTVNVELNEMKECVTLHVDNLWHEWSHLDLVVVDATALARTEVLVLLESRLDARQRVVLVGESLWKLRHDHCVLLRLI